MKHVDGRSKVGLKLGKEAVEDLADCADPEILEAVLQRLPSRLKLTDFSSARIVPIFE